MKFIYKLLCAALAVTSLIETVTVRVLLSDDQSELWCISSSRGLVLRDAKTERLFPHAVTCHSLTIQGMNDSLVVNGKKLKSQQAWLEPLDGFLAYNGNEYDGRFLLTYEKNKWFLVNALDVEEYLYSVLKTESWPGWPLEVNKAFAIASRSYLLHQLLIHEQKDAPYHIKNTNYHQTYQGLHSNDVIRQAVEETRGIFLAHDEYPILAMFDCCCGGVIPAKIAEGIDFAKAPYLARKYPCTYCKDSKLFRWSTSYSVDHFTSVVQEGRTRVLLPIRDIKVAHKDKAGVVHKITIKTQRELFSMKAREVYKLFKGIKSYCFSILKKGKTITVEGKGYGHHMGMCQWGAREMVRLGSSHRDILEFYYPETYFMKLGSREEKISVTT